MRREGKAEGGRRAWEVREGGRGGGGKEGGGGRERGRREGEGRRKGGGEKGAYLKGALLSDIRQDTAIAFSVSCHQDNRPTIVHLRYPQKLIG